MPRYKSPDQKIAEFWAKTERDPKTGCLNWTGYCRPNNGYGTCYIGEKTRQPTYCHRVAWELQHGPIPADKEILHQCDNKRCLEVKHMRLGTRKENAEEASDRGLLKRGSENVNSRLTEVQVFRIRHGSEPTKVLAITFGVKPSYISELRRRGCRKWRHVPFPEDLAY